MKVSQRLPGFEADLISGGSQLFQGQVLEVQDKVGHRVDPEASQPGVRPDQGGDPLVSELVTGHHLGAKVTLVFDFGGDGEALERQVHCVGKQF